MKEDARIAKAVVERLKSIRQEKGLSHEKVAQHAGLHRTTIGQMEAGKIQPTLLTLLKIARALDCDLGRIITRAEN